MSAYLVPTGAIDLGVCNRFREDPFDYLVYVQRCTQRRLVPGVGVEPTTSGFSDQRSDRG